MRVSPAVYGKRQSKSHHWLGVVLILLALATLSVRQADRFPPTVDEFATMIYSGWLTDGYAPNEFFDSFFQRSVGGMPGYYLLLNAWGSLTKYDIVLARILGILVYLLVISLFYKIAADLINSVAGYFALAVVISLAFVNFYIAHASPYLLFVFFSALTTWLYLRILYRNKEPKARDLLAFGAAVFTLVMTHLFSATLLATLGLYHLFFAPKNTRWLMIGIVFSIAVLLCLPFIALTLAEYNTAYSHLDGPSLNAVEAISAWLTIMLNGQTIPLLLVSVPGLFIGYRNRLIGRMPWLALLPLFLVVLAIASEMASLVRTQSMRHQLDGLPLLILFATVVHYALYRWKRNLVVLAGVWVVAGMLFQQHAHWWSYIGFRSAVFLQPPTQVLSRLAVAVEPKPYLVGYPYDQFFTSVLDFEGTVGWELKVTQRKHYFAQHGVNIDIISDLEDFSSQIQQSALHTPFIWHFHQKSADVAELNQAADIIRGHGFELCGTRHLGSESMLQQYVWKLLNCQIAAMPSAYQSDLINYEFYAFGLNAGQDEVAIIDRWASWQDVDLGNYSMSYQVIDEGWGKVAQLDRTFSREGELRRVTIDVHQVEPGTYRLMLILYHRVTGHRLPWKNQDGSSAEFYTLGEITIPGS